MAKILLKDLLFNQPKVERIAGEIARVYPRFPAQAFTSAVLGGFPDRELKARIAWIAECLQAHLPTGYRRAAKILIKALPPPNDPTLGDDDFGDFIYAPYSEFVARHGCRDADLRFSLEALRQITQRFSAEDAIRAFLNAFPEGTMRELLAWTGDPHYHVRRLCSEGTRPRLPWSAKIGIPVEAPIGILDRLFADRTRFVTRSVANHLNDVCRVDPELAIETLTRWRHSGAQRAEEMQFIIRHALRTLVKQGNARALGLLGVRPAPGVQLVGLQVPSRVKMNTALELSFSLVAPSTTKVIVDYAITFRNKAGKLQSRKVFKLTETTLPKREPVAIRKRHLLREKMTTRTLYRGRHQVEVQVNGRCLAKKAFDLR